jgi:hypothetical protein
MDLLKVVDLRRYLYRLQGVMEVHVETLITSTARNKLPEFFYNFSKSINFFYNFLSPYLRPRTLKSLSLLYQLSISK